MRPHQRQSAHREMAKRRIVTVGVVALAMTCASFVTGTAIATASAKQGTTITTSHGPFGTMLVVGSGKYSGYTLYFITSDASGKFGCTTTVLTLGGNSLFCTSPSSDQHAEWPAITTAGAPVAGTGVSQSLLGTVTRKGIGTQITYAGHPLYLFDQGPGQVTGEGWDEPSVPPFHGLWSLVAPSGMSLAWPDTLSTTTIADGKTVLGAIMLTGGGFKTAPCTPSPRTPPQPVHATGRAPSHGHRCLPVRRLELPPRSTHQRSGLSSVPTARPS